MVKSRLKNKHFRGKEHLRKRQENGSTWGTIRKEAKYGRIYKDWRKHYVVLFTRNQVKRTDTSRTRCGSSLLKNLKLKILGPPYDKVRLTKDKQFKHYKTNEYHILLKEGLLFRKYYGDSGNINIKYYQRLIQKQLVKEVLRSLHRDFGKHPGVTKMIIAYR